MKTKVGCPCGVLFSGNANNGANAGLAYANSNNTPSNSNTNIGSHLCLKRIFWRPKGQKDMGIAALPLGKKFQVTRKVLVGTPVVWATERSE